MPVTAPIEENQAATSASVKTRAVSGVKVLAARTLVSVLLRVVSSLVLARLLFPHDYGVFGVVSYITGLSMFLCDAGLAGALVRQHREPTRDETFTVFWSQQVLTALVVAAVIGTSPLLIHLYKLSPAALTLLVVMALSLFLSSLRVIPMMALERDLQFPVIARCELIENLAQTASTIGFAYLGWGAWALAGGGIVRGVVGLLCVWLASPWRPQGRFHFSIVRTLAHFGVAYQLNAIVPTLLGGWMPLVVGRLLGIAAVGLVGWAGNIASAPMMLSGVLNRVAFPAYSRLQSDPEALGRYLISSIRRVSAVFCLLVPLLVIVCPVLIPALFRARWTAAVPLVQWFSLECVLLTLTGLVASAQNATGRAGERLGVTIGVGLARWSLGYVAIACFGLIGIGPLVFLLSLSELLLTCWLVQRRNSGCARLMQEVLMPLLTVGAALGLALGLGLLVGHGEVLPRTAVALVVFVALMAAREVATQGRLLTSELRALVAMFRPSLTGGTA